MDDLEYRVTKLGHAVSLLNNHLPMVGHKYFIEPHESESLMMDDVPATVRAPLMVALTEAARFTATMLRETPPVTPVEPKAHTEPAPDPIASAKAHG